MDQGHRAILENDLIQASSLRAGLLVKTKLAAYAVVRPFWSLFFRISLRRRLRCDKVYKRVNRFLRDDGGMFKEYVYRKSSRFSQLKGADVLAPGIGYGRNLFQLAAFRPKRIVAFDLYEYPEEWKFLSAEIKRRFGVDVEFHRGDFDVLPDKYAGTFDAILSDAVLEHVRDLRSFMAWSYKFLRQGGIFYASFGPLWYGPSGDHAEWGKYKIYDHILLSPENYKAQHDRAGLELHEDSCEAAFMIKEKLFSYLRAKEYLETIENSGFCLADLYAKISMRAWRELKEKPELHKSLDAKDMPQFDRFCGGFYLWARKIQKN